MSMLQIIKKSDYQVMPWKNAKGITSQIEIFPDTASLANQDFLWRISSATVGDCGPFSQFPGFDRYLAILQGDGLILNNKILKPKEVIPFQGDEQITGILINQPVIDLGLIFRRDAVTASMKFFEFQVNQLQEINLDHDINYIFCAQGLMAVSNQIVCEGDCLKIQGLAKVAIESVSSNPVQFFLIGLSMLQSLG